MGFRVQIGGVLTFLHLTGNWRRAREAADLVCGARIPIRLFSMNQPLCAMIQKNPTTTRVYMLVFLIAPGGIAITAKISPLRI
jgi:hypothetical protein